MNTHKFRSNLLANIIDAYVNALNKTGVIPANLATLARSINAKQLGTSTFRPRPVTESNFTKPELDAILRLSDNGNGGYGTISEKSYQKFYDNYGVRARDDVKLDKQKPIIERFSPVGVIRSTIGRAVVSPDGGDHVLRDTYDFNTELVNVLENPDGTFGLGGQSKDDAIKLVRKKISKALENSDEKKYMKIRTLAHSYAHNDKDPDEGKVKVELSLDKIRKMLGDRAGTYDVKKIPDPKMLVRRAMLGGGLTGAGLGALLGLAGGGIAIPMMRNKKKRWWKALLYGSLLGAGALGAAGAAGGYSLANELIKKTASSKNVKTNNGKGRKSRLDWVDIALPSLILLASAGSGYGGNALAKRIFKDVVAKGRRDIGDATEKFVDVKTTTDFLSV